jgi:thiosulfate/3-mercaptopyruvate sulfurtransferase
MPEIRRRAQDVSRTYRFVDCRWELGKPDKGRELYVAGHIPGAVFLDVERDLSAPPVEGGGRHPLPDARSFAEAAGRAGIGHGVLVVAYGSMGGAERLWWLLRHFGHDDVAVLADGIDAWRGPLSAGEEAVEPAAFEPRPRRGDTLDAEAIASRLEDPALVVVDTRLPERFRGEPNPIDRVPGRIPGAVNLPWNGEGTLPPSILDAEEVVVYCGSGVTACVPLHALARAGRPDAKLYPGSWSDWESKDLPVERG